MTHSGQRATENIAMVESDIFSFPQCKNASYRAVHFPRRAVLLHNVGRRREAGELNQCKTVGINRSIQKRSQQRIVRINTRHQLTVCHKVIS